MALKHLKRRHMVAAAVGAAALAIPTAATAADAGTRPGGTPHTGTSCTPVERYVTLAAEQRRVLKLLKGFTVLRNQADVDRLAQPNSATGTQFAALAHMYNSMKGVGMTIVNVGMQGAGMPTLLFYRPDPKATNVTQPYVPNFPYRLAGWGYVWPYTPGKAPSYPTDAGLRCVKPTDWFVHERSVHPADTWQNIPVPPAEDWKGEAAGSTAPTAEECHCQIGEAHPRFWDLHVFLTWSPFPQVSMFNPGRPIPGFDAVAGKGFFYPAKPPV
ncbi:hypothetical protein [Actinomadura harenae]|uniref:Uncharacterized protein n=1 Tax=Actinomadura harenae TaxID=2483351 RepID=A0A3M2LUD1_9ACTN|nr:hypothetical protein [Actinomadura harenae]RMI40716.1 hypothetical protein EBO15_25345 [Actinomadura harenae]